MITLRKLASLPEGTRGRKLLTLLAQQHEPLYEAGLIEQARTLLGNPPPCTVPLLRQQLALYLGVETADWDLQAPPDRQGPVTRFPFSVYLDDLRSPFNVGSLLRTAEAYGFEAVYPSLLTPGLSHPRTKRTAMGAEVHLSVEAVSLAQLRQRWAGPVFALELGGTPVEAFPFPREGLVLVGGEELGLSPEALEWADGSAGRVSLPLYGRKASLNVGVAFGILSAAWTQAVLSRTAG